MVNQVFFFYFERLHRIIGNWSAHSGKASHSFVEYSWLYWAYRWPFTWKYNWQYFLKLMNVWELIINSWSLRIWVACIQQPHTMHGAPHSVCTRCIHMQSQCKKPYQVLQSPWVGSAIWSERKCRYCTASKTLKWEQYWNHSGNGQEIWFSKDRWLSRSYKEFWNPWNWLSYSSQCLLYWLQWYLVVEKCPWTFKDPKFKLQHFELSLWKLSAI